MIEEAIYKAIKDDTALGTKLNAGGGRYHIYPLVVPDAITTVTQAITYTELVQSLTIPNARSSTFQFNCIGDTYTKARDLADDIFNLFHDFNKEKLAGLFWVEYVKFVNRTSFYDSDAKTYIFPVEILFKY